MKVIQTDNLTKYYGKSRGIINVSLSVEEGDFFGFIGPNGAGKSTMIRTILGLISPTCGNATVLGKDIIKDKKEILKDIGYLPAEVSFYSGMKVKDILEFSAKLYHKDCSKEAEYLCKRLSLDPTKKIDELSFGNRKKVGIVCAMQHKPKLYIMDEPTTGLDPLMQREFYELLKERNHAGATIFLSSHILSEVQKYCKHAAVIKEGKIIVLDSVDHLGTNGAKRVTIQGIQKIVKIDGMKNLKITEDSLSFLYNGKLDILLKLLSDLPVTDLTIAEPDLEEIFMHYYEKESTNDNI